MTSINIVMAQNSSFVGVPVYVSLSSVPSHANSCGNVTVMSVPILFKDIQRVPQASSEIYVFESVGVHMYRVCNAGYYEDNRLYSHELCYSSKQDA